MKVEPDGSFQRAASSFRDVIEKRGAFKPELGKADAFFALQYLEGVYRQIPSLCFICMP